MRWGRGEGGRKGRGHEYVTRMLHSGGLCSWAPSIALHISMLPLLLLTLIGLAQAKVRPQFRHIATFQAYCHISGTLPQFSHNATIQAHCHNSVTLPQFSHIATIQAHCHNSVTLPQFRHIATIQAHCHNSGTLSQFRHIAAIQAHCHSPC